MSEQEFSTKSAQPERYINRFSATIVTVFKLLDGIVAGFVLYHIIRLIAPVVAEMSKGALDVNRALQIVLSEFGLPQTIQDVYKNIMIGGIALPFIFWGGLLLVVIIGLVLVVIEAVALLSVRLTQRGAVYVKVIHQIYMGVCVVYLLLLAYSAVEYYQNRQNLVGTVRTDADITFIIVGVIELIIFLLYFCYHKDIAMAMNTVMYEVETGNQGKFRRTHLSGISFIFGLPYAFLILIIVLGIVGIKTDASLSQYKMTIMDCILAIGVPAILLIKHLSVSFCYRNLKRAR